ncbi:MAG TPA: glycoside hydrolase family 31 protein, partial [Alphaproteobacteria bacterium]|nr:glycoside hydrolase family 31 protein [Alphaproteobacteria bacterium]
QWDMEPFGQVLTPLPESGILDFTHPDAYAWWRDRHAELFAAGVDAMKPDFGEQVPEHARAHNGDDGKRLHNVYPLLYNRCVFEATEQASPGAAMVFSRAGWAGSQRYPMQWGGDPQSDWEGLAASLRGGLSWGLSGAPCYATDIGGFYGAQPDAELFVRWTAAAVFSSHMRFHGIGPREPWAFGPEAEEVIRGWLELRYRLLPYIEGTLAEAARTGLPVQRAMALAFPEDPASWAFDDQFLFGRDLLVAPVIRPGGAVRYYLPRGTWRDFWTGQAVEGGRVCDGVEPLDRLPVFVRDGSAIALGPAVRHTGELEGRPRVEEVRHYGDPVRPPVAPDGPIGDEVRIVPMGGS